MNLDSLLVDNNLAQQYLDKNESKTNDLLLEITRTKGRLVDNKITYNELLDTFSVNGRRTSSFNCAMAYILASRQNSDKEKKCQY